jgi:hypothetical protein
MIYMKKIALVSLLLSLLFLSCNKDDDFPNALMKCQVSEFHLATYDLYFTDFPFLFKKTYDPSGKILKEISCLFWNDQPPTSQFVTPHDLVINSHGRKIFLLNKHDLLDTVVKITLNIAGRPESCESKKELNESNGKNFSETEHFVYKYNRLVFVQATSASVFSPIPYTSTYPLVYDNYGNMLSFGGNVYQYDYNRRAKKQFYCDDLMATNNGFYLLQYLGFFPEVNSPVNLRKHGFATTFQGDFNNHTFDSDGKLTGYYFGGLKATITWNCKGGNLNNYINAGSE